MFSFRDTPFDDHIGSQIRQALRRRIDGVRPHARARQELMIRAVRLSNDPIRHWWVHFNWLAAPYIQGEPGLNRLGVATLSGLRGVQANLASRRFGMC